MTIKQLSVFIENRKGRLGEVLAVLKEKHVSILSMSLADTTEYGLLRLIVTNPEEGRQSLLDAGFSSMVTEVFVLKIPHRAGSLQETLSRVAERGINVEYMYGLSVGTEDACVVMKAGDVAVTAAALSEEGIETLTEEELSAL